MDGISAGAAQVILTEVGPQLAAFPSEDHFVSWLRLCPRTPISGGKPVRKRRNGLGANRIAGVLRMAATSLQRSKTALGASFRRVARHKGGAVAVFATARQLARLVYPMLRYGHDYVEITRVNGTMINQNQVAADFAAKTLGFKTFALIHDTTDYGRAHAKYFAQFVEKAGGKVLSTQGTAKDQKDYAAELTRAKADRPEVLWYGGLTPDGVRVRVQMEKVGVRAQFQGTSGIKSDTFNETAGAAAEGSLAFVEGAPTETSRVTKSMLTPSTIGMRPRMVVTVVSTTGRRRWAPVRRIASIGVRAVFTSWS